MSVVVCMEKHTISYSEMHVQKCFECFILHQVVNFKSKTWIVQVILCMWLGYCIAETGV